MRTPPCTSLLAAVLGACLVLGIAPASALAAPPVTAPAAKPRKATPKEEEEARAAVKRGLALAGRGEAAEALQQYERAKELVPDANLPYRYAAQALVDLGRIEEAIANLEKYLEIDTRVSDADAVRERIAELKAKLPGKVTITSTPLGASVLIDGSDMGKTPLSVSLRPGEHTVVVRQPGFETAERKVTASGTHPAELAFELVKTPAPAVKAPAPATPAAPAPIESPREQPRSGSGRTTVGLIIAGVGVGLLGTSFILSRNVDSTRDEFDSVRRSGRDALPLKDRGETEQTLTVVTLIAGGVLAVGGVTLALWPSSKSTVAVSPSGATWRTVF